MRHYIVNYQEPAYSQPTNHMLVDQTGKIILSSNSGIDDLVGRIGNTTVEKDISQRDLQTIRGKYAGGEFISVVRLDPSIS